VQVRSFAGLFRPTRRERRGPYDGREDAKPMAKRVQLLTDTAVILDAPAAELCKNRARVSATETKALIARAVEHLREEVPALRQLKLVVKLELRARGGDAPIWRVEVPGPKIDRDPAGDARLDVSVARSHFNELAEDGHLRHWVDAYERGYVNVSGDAGVMKLLGNVIQRQQARARTTS
jgi:hypothetical protein